MERTNGIQKAMKTAATVLFLAAAMASTGCGQNALLNPTAAQVAAGQLSQSAAVDQTSHLGGQPTKP
jgi:hypothetical protein